MTVARWLLSGFIITLIEVDLVPQLSVRLGVTILFSSLIADINGFDSGFFSDRMTYSALCGNT